MYTAAIIGAAGMVGGELYRILQDHPEIGKITAVSQSQGGKKIGDVHKDLYRSGETFAATIEREHDVYFLCGGHGTAEAALEKLPLGNNSLVIDLSRDHRIGNKGGFVYGLPEFFSEEIRNSQRIANPGCFATALQLALLPLAKAQLLPEEIIPTAITGSTGAGIECSPTVHYSNRSGNVSVYKSFEHEHRAEIEQSIGKMGMSCTVPFIPVRGNFTRGIFGMIALPSNMFKHQLLDVFKNIYDDADFVSVLEGTIEMKQVVNTNNAVIGISKSGNNTLITVAIDNLLKGAAGQAIQNMNICLGIKQTSGLQFKSIAY